MEMGQSRQVNSSQNKSGNKYMGPYYCYGILPSKMSNSIANITKVVVLYKGSAQPEIHDEGGEIEAKIYIVRGE